MTSLIGRRQPFSVFILYFLSFALLMEWLWPLELLTDMDRISIYVIFAAISFLFSYFRIPSLISATVKIGYILYIYHALFYHGKMLSLEWTNGFRVMVSKNMHLIIEGHWWDLTGDFRSILFFVLMWLVIYVIKYWLSIQNRIFFFLFLTAVYVTVLDAFTPYHAKFAIVRVVLIGFLLVSFLYLSRIKKEELVSSFATFKWTIPMLVFLLCAMTFAFLAPKAQPYLPDPVPYFKSFANEAGSGANGPHRVGYSVDDSRLGGPFIQDNTTVFAVKTPKAQYWRVETKNFYTGLGWETSPKVNDITMGNNYVPLTWSKKDVKKTPLDAILTFHLPYPHLVYPMGLAKVDASQPVHFRVNPYTEKITTYSSDNSELVKLSSYYLKYEYPSYSINAMEQAHISDEKQLDPKFLDMYTQLPETLPKRVKELANNLISDKTNLYDEVKAVENYFRFNGFIYDINDVAVPSKDEDYVDQFLFTTKKGYCDNFSSSMVVLLRAVGIPARWVKGYSQGEEVESNSSMKEFKITNNDAHSWVEAYFPNSGWVPFEPTLGFTNPTDFKYNLDEKLQHANIPIPPKKDLSKLKNNDKAQKSTQMKNSHHLKEIFQRLSWKDMTLALLALAIIIFGLYLSRRKWSPYMTILKYKYRKDERVFYKSYPALLKQLQAFGIEKKDGQTLREFAAYVDKFFRSNDMKTLTYSYEKVLYHQDIASGEWTKSIELWEKLIKRTVS